MDSGSEQGDSLERRVASLESVVRELQAELRALRRDAAPAPTAPPSEAGIAPVVQPLGTPRVADIGAAAHPAPPPPPHEFLRPQAARYVANLDFESLVGRYGTLVLATVSGLAAVGTFIGWAIARGWLGPTQRVGLGLLVAAALAVGGFRLRKRERSFGASLLGLSLAVVHVCAWGAGPSLHLVPDWVAFLIAATASIALAIFAHGEADEPLWSVGFSGAAIAPFVTSSGKGSLPMLAAYGVAVLSTSGFAMGARRWIVAGRLFLLAAALYVGALATGRERDAGPLLATGFPLVVAILGVVPWIMGWPRRERLRALGALATLAALRAGFGTDFRMEHATVSLLIAAAGVVWLILVDRTHRVEAPAEPTSRYLHEGDWLDAAVLPLGFVLASVIALDGTARESGTALAAAAGVMLVAVARSPHGSLRDASAFVVSLCALVAAMLLLKGRKLELTVAIAALSAAALAANVVWRSATWSFMGALGLTWSVIASLAHLDDRVSYQYTPFGTNASGVSLAVLVAIVAGWKLARDERMENALRRGALIWAFLWVHQELAFAFSQTASILLLVSYYATTSVAAVWVGRARAIRLLRHAGLALAVAAAGMALYGARHLDAIGARIAADLVAAVFLLAIAYWYRKPGTTLPESVQTAAPGGHPV